jgi:hypothetical protein
VRQQAQTHKQGCLTEIFFIQRVGSVSPTRVVGRNSKPPRRKMKLEGALSFRAQGLFSCYETCTSQEGTPVRKNCTRSRHITAQAGDLASHVCFLNRSKCESEM